VAERRERGPNQREKKGISELPTRPRTTTTKADKAEHSYDAKGAIQKREGVERRKQKERNNLEERNPQPRLKSI